MITLHHKSESTSTNDDILGYITPNIDIVSVYTFNQTNGRGQYGNVWKITPGQNLAYTLAIATKDISLSSILFNYHTALLVREFLAIMTQNSVEIKWPNDLIINNKKVVGMLIENKKIDNTSYYIVGIGINVLQNNFENLHKAGSLLTTTQQTFDLNQLTVNLDDYLKSNLTKPITENLILKKYQNHLFRRDKISVFQKNGLRQNGMIIKTDEDGYIWIELEQDGLKKFFHKEIEMLY